MKTSSSVAPGRTVLLTRKSADRRNAPAINERETVAELIDFIHVMGRHDHGAVEPVSQIEDALPNCFTGGGIEADRRFIEKQHGRSMEQALRDFEPPDHSAGIMPGKMMGCLRKSHPSKGTGDALAAVLPRNAVKPR